LTEDSLLETVRETLSEPIDGILSEATFGTTDPDAIAAFCRDLVTERLGANVTACTFFTQSVGAVFGVSLDDGSRVAVKAHGASPEVEPLRAAYKVQQWLHGRAYPCPGVRAAPGIFRGTVATIQDYVDDGEFRDPHDPVVRRAMAEALAALVDRAQLLKHTTGIKPHLPPDALLPRPHSVLYNFEASSKSAGWIDEAARRARAVLERSVARPVLGHADWSAKNMRFADREITVVYDFDSLRLCDEMALIGGAAVHFTIGHGPRERMRPSREESVAFLREYALARKKALTDERLERASAGAAYALAYTARCEHARDPSCADFSGSFRELLEQARGLDYLS
jgi:hypothetical protein